MTISCLPQQLIVRTNEIIARQERIYRFIQRGAATTPSGLAAKMGISTRTLHYDLLALQDRKMVMISYNRHTGKYEIE